MNKILLLPLLVIFLSPLAGEEKISLDLTLETGFLAVASHEIQSGTDSDRGDVFNYKIQGNQDILFPFNRMQADLSVKKHSFLLLYQPLTLTTTAPIREDFRYDQIDFTTADGFLSLVYAFDFWRFSYLYELISSPAYYLELGGSLQIRNASIIFETSENGKGTVSDNIGPVPIVKVKTGYEWPTGYYAEFEGDGFYATNRIFNGADYPFTGYIYDLSLRGGYRFREDIRVYLNGRFLGGGAEGTNDSGEYTYNDLHTFSLTMGGVWSL